MTKAQLNIIIRALRIRKERGEDPSEAVKGYPKLTPEEVKYVLSQV